MKRLAPVFAVWTLLLIIGVVVVALLVHDIDHKARVEIGNAMVCWVEVNPYGISEQICGDPALMPVGSVVIP